MADANKNPAAETLTLIPAWAVAALGGPDATRKTATELRDSLRSAGYSSRERARIGRFTLLQMAEAAR